MMQQKRKWMITIAIAVCMFTMLGLGNSIAATNKPATNVLGSDPANINANRSFVTVQGDWIYYNNDGLYKMKKDGSSTQRLSSDWADNLNVVGDWIYYVRGKPFKEIYQLEMPAYNINQTYEDVTELIKMRTDGTSKTVIKSGSLVEGDPNNVSRLFVAGAIIYYADDYGRLYTMDTNGKNQKKLLDQYEEVYFYQDWLFYTTDSRQLYKIKQDGTQKKLVSTDKDMTLIGLSGDFLYYTKWIYEKKVTDVYKIGLKDGKTALVKKGLPLVNGPIMVAGEHLYYISDNMEAPTVTRMDLNNGKTTPLYRFSRNASQAINIAGDSIFFYDDQAADSSKIDIFKVKMGENKVEKLGAKVK